MRDARKWIDEHESEFPGPMMEVDKILIARQMEAFARTRVEEVCFDCNAEFRRPEKAWLTFDVHGKDYAIHVSEEDLKELGETIQWLKQKFERTKENTTCHAKTETNSTSKSR